MNPPLRSASASPKPSGFVSSVIFTVVLTIITTVATNYVIVKFSLMPPEPKAPVARVIGLAKPKPVAKPAAAAPTDSAGGDQSAAERQTTDGATAAVNAISAILSNGVSYVGPGIHQGLFGDLTRVQLIANKILKDAESNPDQAAKSTSTLTAALDQAIGRVNAIGQRPSESADSVQMSQQIEATLSEIRSTLP
jgi:hypothetical protein